MSKFNQRLIQSISTGPQLSEPLSKDVIIGPAPGRQYIQRRRYLYQWPNRQERNLDKIKLYRGTITPLPSQIRFYRNRARRVITIFENGHDIEPPLLKDSQIPYATIVTTREFLCEIPSSVPRQESPFDFPERSLCSETSNDDSPTRTVVPSHTHPATNDPNDWNRGESTTGEKRRREFDTDEREDAPKRLKPAFVSLFVNLRLS